MALISSYWPFCPYVGTFSRRDYLVSDKVLVIEQNIQVTGQLPIWLCFLDLFYDGCMVLCIYFV